MGLSKKQFRKIANWVILAVFVSLMFFLMKPFSNDINLVAVNLVGDNVTGGSVIKFSMDYEPGFGKDFLDISSLTKFDTQYSLKEAKRFSCNILGKSCDLYDFHYAIDSDSGIVGGPSAGSAMTLTYLASLNKEKIPDDIAVTGFISSGGWIGPVGGIEEKILAAKKIGIKKIYIPSSENTFNGKNLNLEYSGDGFEVIPVENIFELYEKIFGKKIVDFSKEQETTSYDDVLRDISDDLCDRSHEYYSFFTNKSLTDSGEATIFTEQLANLSRKREDLRNIFSQKDFLSDNSPLVYVFNFNSSRYLDFLDSEIQKADLNCSLIKDSNLTSKSDLVKLSECFYFKKYDFLKEFKEIVSSNVFFENNSKEDGYNVSDNIDLEKKNETFLPVPLNSKNESSSKSLYNVSSNDMKENNPQKISFNPLYFFSEIEKTKIQSESVSTEKIFIFSSENVQYNFLKNLFKDFISEHENMMELRNDYLSEIEKIKKNKSYSEKLFSELNFYGSVFSYFDEAVRLINRSERLYDENFYYSSSSSCFGANLDFSFFKKIYSFVGNDLFNESFRKNLSSSFLNSFRNQLNFKLNAIGRELMEYDIELDLSVENPQIDYVVNSRYQDAVKRFKSTVETTKDFNFSRFENKSFVSFYNEISSTLNDISYIENRLDTSKKWAKFKESDLYDSSSKKIPYERLSDICFDTYNLAKIDYEYLKDTFGTNLYKKELDLIEEDMQNGLYYSCIFDSISLRSRYNTIFAMSSTKNQDELFLEKEKLARFYIKNNENDFPLLSYSYLEYGNALKNEDFVSALSYIEQSIEFNNLPIEFLAGDSLGSKIGRNSVNSDGLSVFKSFYFYVLYDNRMLFLYIIIISLIVELIFLTVNENNPFFNNTNTNNKGNQNKHNETGNINHLNEKNTGDSKEKIESFNDFVKRRMGSKDKENEVNLKKK